MTDKPSKEIVIDPGRLPSFVNKDGLHLFRKYWSPGGSQTSVEHNPRALIFISHGVAEHCMRYSRLAKFLAERNFLVFSHDHVGHGQSEGDRVYVDDVDDYVADVFYHTDLMKKRYPGKYIFCIGHSMGGTIAIRAAMLRQEYFKGLVLISPALSPNPYTFTPFKKMLAKLLSNACPQATLDRLDVKTLCRDPNVVKEIEEDPLYYHGGLKAKWGAAMLRMFDVIQKYTETLRFPLLLLHGGRDHVTSIDASRRFFDNIKSEDKTFKEYAHAYHQLHFEPDGVALSVQDEICEWIERRI